MLETVEGTYSEGKIELKETPPGIRQARVLVTFLPEETPKPAGAGFDYGKYARRDPNQMTFGQFPGDGMSTEEDFKLAEWHPTEAELNGD